MSGSGVVAVDVGKTDARAVISYDDGRPALVTSSAGLPGLAAPGGVETATRLVTQLIRSATDMEHWDGWRVCVGLPGALAAPDRAQQLADRLARELAGAAIAVASDAVTAHCGALAGAPGIVATLGTGVSVLALAADGTHFLVDGAGHYIGDRGGGAEIGRHGLRAVLQARDGAGPPTALAAAAAQRFGPLEQLAAHFAGADNPARPAASFAPDVAASADAGDPVAQGILHDAAGAIAASIQAARARTAPDLPVVLTGGLTNLGDALLGPLRDALDGLELRVPGGDALAGAALLADNTATGWEANVFRRRGADRSGEALDLLATEQARPGSDALEELPTTELVDVLLQHEGEALEALRSTSAVLAVVVDAAAKRMRDGGRLIYVGAGTPGRLAFLDAAECVPTFGVSPDVVVALIAGGEQAFRLAVEGAEDDSDQGARDLEELVVGPLDTVVGITASGRTPYVLGALGSARTAGAMTVGIANNVGSAIGEIVDHVIEIDSGPEVIAGSTRLAAGTTQKLTLNTLSTGVMVRLGKTYRGRMVDVLATNDKLRRRVVQMVRDLTGADEAEAAGALAAADGEVKVAVVSLLGNLSPDQARAALDAAGGQVSAALDGRG
jgi:N-acetylmuramic acid 6-phosphate etherase